MHGFAYHRPATRAEAAALLKEGATAIAGGMSLLPVMKHRLATPSAIVDLAGIPDLVCIAQEGDALTIGAMTRHVVVAESPVVRDAIPALAALAGGIGDPAVRNRGTIGGVLANADPSADYPAAVVGLDATVMTDRREIEADAMFSGLFETALMPGEIITGVRFPVPLAAAYAKFRSPASRYAIVGVFVARFPGGVRVAVTGAGPCVFRVPAMEAALATHFVPDVIAGMSVAADGLNGDIHADPAYRAHLIGVMAARAVTAAAGVAA
jgi:aerobic carbon-monoxide dehydrogenase medium subunit